MIWLRLSLAALGLGLAALVIALLTSSILWGAGAGATLGHSLLWAFYALYEKRHPL